MSYIVGDVIQNDLQCKICHAHELKVVAIQGRHFQDLTTVICTGCGLVHSYPIPTEEDLSAYYSKQYRSDYKSAYTPQRKHIARYARNAVSRIKNIKQFTDTNVSLIDVGSGSGEFIYAAKLAGFNVQGIEPHDGYSCYTRKTFDVPVVTATFQNADISPESADVITLHHVLEHFPDPLSALIHVSKWLKYNGIMVIDVPDIENMMHSPRNRFHYAHIYNFNHDTLKAILTKAGYDLIDHPAHIKGTVLAARKVREADSSMEITMPDNYTRLYSLLMQGAEAEHYQKKRPIKRFFNKCYCYPKEFIKGVYLWQPKKIVECEINSSNI